MDLGARCDARLVGIAACQPIQFTYGDDYIDGRTMAACQDELRAELRTAEAEFREALKDNPLPVEWRSSYTIDALPDYLASEARCADLIVTSLAAADPFDSSRHTSIGDLVVRAGRPLLAVPHSGARIPFDRILVAWKDTREARRAVAEALPLLALAKHVTVLEIAEQDDVPTALSRVQDVTQWLALHRVKAVPLAVASNGADAVQLGSILNEQETDLVVAGAYGHNRLREWAFGGVTHALLQGGRCALLSH
ncbi:universal stress protein [Novosphingobium sp. Rr 2-17]|uniref:universal stress protein n=1 Tax=Novosphingobium sp. Rr 2-17 TaxID=555793 RepID=UPI0012F6B64B|nr:universal stress protein [Novosphingobium sp. Rr 2-17]